MRPCYRLALLGVAAISIGCNEQGPSLPLGTESTPQLSTAVQGQTPILVGSAQFTRTVGAVTAPTSFSFNVRRQADGSAEGQYNYDFRAAGFAVGGHVTCATVLNNQAWVSGVVDRVITDDPSFETLLGLEMWWRSKDMGRGDLAPNDSTTGLGFGFPGSVITGASWCRDQPVALIMRMSESGNLTLF